MSETETKYYNELLKNFGGIHLAGAKYCAEVMARLNEDTNITNIKYDLSEVHNVSFSAVDRAIRVYLEHIQETYTIQELSAMMDYTFKPHQKNLQPLEFLSLFKYIVDTEQE